MPRMNSIMERWIQSCRHELLDRTLIWNPRHLLHALHEYEHHHNAHRPTEGSRTPGQYVHCRTPSPIQTRITRLDIRRRDRLSGILHEYEHAA
jgi:putative transposase